MADVSKGKSPFYPGQPVPAEYFVGRKELMQRILERGAGQVAAGKPVSLFIEGEYGIGKSSIAAYAQAVAERKHGLYGIYASLGGSHTLDEMAEAILQGTLHSGALEPSRAERMRNWLARYIGHQMLFGVEINAQALKADAPQIASPHTLLDFLRTALQRLENTGVRGISLVLDEINSIAANPDFAYFIKGLIDTNATARRPLPLLLILCGVEERRREMIQRHQPVDRIFDIVDVGIMDDDSVRDFFRIAFASVHMELTPEANRVMTEFTAGFPKIMHMIGDSAYWIDMDGVVDEQDALRSIADAAEDVGRKFVDQQVYRALRSRDYHAILAKLGKLHPESLSFTRAELEAQLTATERGKLGNFLQRMKRLHVLRSGDVRGEYVFNIRMVRLYIWLQSAARSAGG